MSKLRTACYGALGLLAFLLTSGCGTGLPQGVPASGMPLGQRNTLEAEIAVRVGDSVGRYVGQTDGGIGSRIDGLQDLKLFVKSNYLGQIEWTGPSQYSFEFTHTVLDFDPAVGLQTPYIVDLASAAESKVLCHLTLNTPNGCHQGYGSVHYGDPGTRNVTLGWDSGTIEVHEWSISGPPESDGRVLITVDIRMYDLVAAPDAFGGGVGCNEDFPAQVRIESVRLKGQIRAKLDPA